MLNFWFGFNMYDDSMDDPAVRNALIQYAPDYLFVCRLMKKCRLIFVAFQRLWRLIFIHRYCPILEGRIHTIG